MKDQDTETSLDAEKKVVHDHNIVNYNEEYEFMNVECCVHLLRDLKKVVDNLGHEWPKKMINLLLEENTKRNEGGSSISRICRNDIR